ncbi:putative cobaltochelatase [Rugamonas sp. CCM 8940]|uniref:putative cobaltochelatase n=1 Tax=Rugamonas sp. CCM 8940 TaxID=2765359 RepID=UPI0018F75A0F|nr:putative cobaltochelatase [Rugamonas sp. CCM 8940]MBJ7312490.1 putative cobaltochelatase [Rugamonas sp. CCM 8940]
MRSTNFPFAAVVGQPKLQTALLLCAVDPSMGGVLIRGDKGTAKSTAARALADILPRIDRVAGCAFNCSSAAPSEHCEVCRADGAAADLSAVPFVTLPLGATEDRVLGSLDVASALQGGGRVFQAGLLASAHRGILYIDEVNLLADHLVDVLLDVAAMGVNSVQREGLSIRHPARFTLIGTMNLEEGDLRPQLLDRFALMVEVAAPRDKAVRSEVVRRRIAYEADPLAYVAAWQSQQDALNVQLATAQQLLPQVELDDTMLDLISHLCCEFEVASLRADIVMHKAARALAALDGRLKVTPGDLRSAAELVLPHRRRRKPFEQPGLDQDKLDDLMRQAQKEEQEQQEQKAQQEQQEQQEQGQGDEADSDEDAAEQPSANDAQEQPEQMFASGSSGAAPHLTVAASSRIGRNTMGRRSDALNAVRGRVVRAVPDENPTSLAVGATLRSAVLRDPGNFNVTKADLHQQIRVGKSANLILFVVDASGSMAAQRRMEAVKGTVLALLTDAYQRRDEVAVIAFRGQSAQLLLAPTRSVERAEQGLSQLPTGGRTPLPHAMQLALETLERGTHTAPPLLVLLTDGKANVALAEGGDPWRETLALAESLAERGVPALVLDTETGYLKLGRAAQLAQALGAECLTLEQLSADNLVLTIRARLGAV